MLSVQIDERQMDEMIQLELQRRLEDLTHRHTFWDMKELSRQTNMSETFIKDQFFYDKRFPKFRVGRKWLMPAKEAEDFLLMWLKEQARN